MLKEEEVFFITNPQQDITSLRELIRVTNIGVEAIMHMYNDHRRDPKVYELLLLRTENVVYRISAVMTQYELLMEGLKKRSVIDLKDDPFDGPYTMHPKVYAYSCELSSMADSIFFHLCSAFDYVGHFISYIFLDNKTKTLDWDSLAKTAWGKWKDTYKTSLAIQKVDTKLRKRLDDYRSELIHRSRDIHMIGAMRHEGSDVLNLKFFASDDTMRHFRKLFPGHEDIVPAYKKQARYTLDLLCSAVLYETLHLTNALVTCLRFDLLAHSTFRKNIQYPKTDAPHPYDVKMDTEEIFPCSEKIWSEYQNPHETLLVKLNGRWKIH
jgi:hypothetical protein